MTKINWECLSSVCSDFSKLGPALEKLLFLYIYRIHNQYCSLCFSHLLLQLMTQVSLSFILSQFSTSSSFMEMLCSLIMIMIWYKVTSDILPQSFVYLSPSTESHGDEASGHLASFYFPNISSCLVLLQLRGITTAQKISTPISVVLETVELIRLIWPKDSSQTLKALLVFLLKMLQTAACFYRYLLMWKEVIKRNSFIFVKYKPCIT